MSHYIFNYQMLRWGLVVVVILCIVFINYFLIKNKTKKIIRIEIIIGIVLYFIINMVPFEKGLIKFSTPKQLFCYYNPSGKLIKEYVYGDYAFVYSKNSDGNSLESYIYKNGSWVVDKKASMQMRKYKSYSIYTSKNSTGTATGILIIAATDMDEHVNIKDNLSSHFDIFEYPDKLFHTSKFVKGITIIPQNLNSDYTLFINGEEYKPF